MKSLPSLLALILWCSGASPVSAEMTVHFIDVGQGGAVLIQTSNKTILYDCGDTFAGPDMVDYLTTLDIVAIDTLIISHAHKDHMGGCIDVVRNFKVTTLYHNGSKARTGIWRKFLKAVKPDTQVKVVETDLQAEGFRILVAYDAPRSKRFSKEADNSLLVHLKDGTVTMLLTGDCEAVCEKQIVKTSNVRSRILNVGHHGSSAASSPEFLAQVKPEIAIAQVGVRNQYDHPTLTVRKRLKAADILLYRTDLAGSVVVHSDGEQYEVETEK